MVIFPSPAGGSIKPAAAGVQALTMTSPGSAWTPVLAGLRQLICRRRKNTKSKPTSYTLYRTGTKYRSGQGFAPHYAPRHNAQGQSLEGYLRTSRPFASGGMCLRHLQHLEPQRPQGDIQREFF